MNDNDRETMTQTAITFLKDVDNSTTDRIASSVMEQLGRNILPMIKNLDAGAMQAAITNKAQASEFLKQLYQPNSSNQQQQRMRQNMNFIVADRADAIDQLETNEASIKEKFKEVMFNEDDTIDLRPAEQAKKLLAKSQTNKDFLPQAIISASKIEYNDQ